MTLYARNDPNSPGLIDVRDFESPPPALKGWLLLTIVAAPTITTTQVAELSIQISGGIATEVWAVRDKTAAEIESEELQAEREQINAYLAEVNTQLDITNVAYNALSNADKLNVLRDDRRITLKCVKFLLRAARRGL
jgi:hypothetical protein